MSNTIGRDLTVLDLRDSLTRHEDRCRLDLLIIATGLEVDDPVSRLRNRRAVAALLWLARTDDDQLVQNVAELIAVTRITYTLAALDDARETAIAELTYHPHDLDDTGAEHRHEPEATG